MKSLITAKAESGDIDIEWREFAGGERHVRVVSDVTDVDKVEITAHVRDANGILDLLMLRNALKHYGCVNAFLRIPYLPYARQDRVCRRGEAFSLEVMCDLLNYGDFSGIEVWDVHNETALEMRLDVTNIPASKFIRDFGIIAASNFVVVAPDAGGIQRAAGVADTIHAPLIKATKTRDPETGEVTSRLDAEHVGNKDFLIVDDICDGGRTFIGLANKLRPLTTGQIFLYVTHGIFSYGTHVFDGIIDHVIVANSFVENLPKNFHLIGEKV